MCIKGRFPVTNKPLENSKGVILDRYKALNFDSIVKRPNVPFSIFNDLKRNY